MKELFPKNLSISHATIQVFLHDVRVRDHGRGCPHDYCALILSRARLMTICFRGLVNFLPKQLIRVIFNLSLTFCNYYHLKIPTEIDPLDKFIILTLMIL